MPPRCHGVTGLPVFLLLCILILGVDPSVPSSDETSFSRQAIPTVTSQGADAHIEKNSTGELGVHEHHFSPITRFSIRRIDDVDAPGLHDRGVRRDHSVNHFGRRLDKSPGALARAPFGPRIHISFTAGGRVNREYFDLDLDLHDSLIHPAAGLYVNGANEALSAAPNMAYKGLLRDSKEPSIEVGWVRAVVVDEETAFIYVFHYDTASLLVVEPLEVALRHSPTHADARRLSLSIDPPKMISYRHTEDVRRPYGINSSWKRMRVLLQRHAASRRRTVLTSTATSKSGNLRRELPGEDLPMPEWLVKSQGRYRGKYGIMSGTSNGDSASCPVLQHTIKIGIAVDAGFYQAVSGSSTANEANNLIVAATVTNIVNLVNVLYTDQINVYVQLADLIFYSNPNTGRSWDNGNAGSDWNQAPVGGDPWFDGNSKHTMGCPNSDTEKVLGAFRAWISSGHMAQESTDGPKYALWHLLTNCFPAPGTIGLAYGGVTCFEQGWNTGLSSWSSILWSVFAHELGHNFGADHTMNSGGIMSYDVAPEFKFTGKNPYEICAHVMRKIVSNSQMGGEACYRQSGSVCGNGILEAGEECDGDSCCIAGTCKLKSTAYCSHVSNVLLDTGNLAEVVSECCNSECKPTGTNRCGRQGRGGFCFNGACMFSDPVVDGVQGWCKWQNTFPCERSGGAGFTMIGQEPDPCMVSCAWDSSPTTCEHGPAQSPAYMPEGTVCAPATAAGGFATCQNNICSSAVDPKLNESGGDGTDSGGNGNETPNVAAITITEPNAGSLWTVGNTYSVSYSTDSIPANANIILALKRFPGLTDVAETLTSTNVGSFSFPLPLVPDHGGDWGTQYQLCLTTTLASTCSVVFAVLRRPSIDSVTISPATTVQVGSILNIGWTFTGSVANVNLLLMRNNVVDRSIQNSRVASTKSFAWTVPSSGLVTGNDVFKVKIENSADSSISSQSLGTFSIILSPSISILLPLSILPWTQGQASEIVFSTMGLDSNSVSIKVYDIDQNEVLVIAYALAVIGDEQSVSVSAQQTNSLVAMSGYTVIIRETTTGAIFAISEDFTVSASTPSGAITISAPQICTAGYICTINFVATDFSPSLVKITYAGSDSGSIIESLPISSSPYAWLVPTSLQSGSYRITAQALDGGLPLVSGVSNSLSILAVPSIYVSSPAYGDVLEVSSVVTIRWEGVNLIDSDTRLDRVDIILLDAVHDAPVVVMASSVQGSYAGGTIDTLSLPVADEEFPKTGNAYKVRVRSSSVNDFFSDSNVFSIINPPVIEVTSPPGRSMWSQGSVCPIKFSISGYVKQVKIELVRVTSEAGEIPIQTSIVQIIATPWASAVGVNSFSGFRIPDSTPLGSRYAIVVTSLSNNEVSSGLKDGGTFTISPKPILDILNPILGASLFIGKNNIIQWKVPEEDTLVSGKLNIDIVRYRSGAKDGADSLLKLEAGVQASAQSKIWYAARNSVGNLVEGATNYAVLVTDSNVPERVDQLYALVRTYPDAVYGLRSDSYIVVSAASGAVRGLLLRYSLSFSSDHTTLRPSTGSSGGIRIHTGKTCADAEMIGDHYYIEGAQDPWTKIMWNLGSKNVVLVPELSPRSLPNLENLQGHAIVVYANDGRPIGCGILRSSVHGESAPVSLEPQNSLSILSIETENDNNEIYPGSAVTLKWRTTGHLPSVDVKLMKSSDSSIVKVIRQQVKNTGNIRIVVPPDAPTTYDCRFIVSSGSDVEAAPSKSFRIVNSRGALNLHCKFVTPAYTSWTENTAVKITNFIIQWSCGTSITNLGPYTHVMLVLLSRNQPDYMLVLNGGNAIPNTGQYSWHVEARSGERYVLKLTPCSIDGAKTLPSAIVYSNEFNVIPAKPTIGEHLLMSGDHDALTKGGRETFTWSSSGIVGELKFNLFECLDILCNRNEFVEQINEKSVQASENSFSWSIPLTSPPKAGVRYKVRARSKVFPKNVFADSSIFTVLDYTCSLGSTEQCDDQRRISVTSPTSGAIVELGRPLSIKWSVAGKNKIAEWTELAVMIQLTRKFSETGDDYVVHQIIEQTGNTGEYIWYPPVENSELMGSHFSIRVLPIDMRILDANTGIMLYRSECPPRSLSAGNCASGDFSISVRSTMEASSMQVSITDIHTVSTDSIDLMSTSPSTSREDIPRLETSVSFVIGKTYPVTWEIMSDSIRSLATSAETATYTVSLYLSDSAEGTSKRFASGLPLSGSHSVLIPSDVVPSYPSASYLIEAAVIHASDGSREGTSSFSSKFRVSAAETITTTAPAGDGKTLVKGSTFNVQWEYTGVPFNVDVYLFSGARGINRRTVSTNGTLGDRCVFPFLYQGHLVTSDEGCVSGDSFSSYFGGQEWCATSVDTVRNPLSRKACVPLDFVSTVAGTGALDEEALLPVDIDKKLYRYTLSEFGLPPAGPQFHLVLYSQKDRSVFAYSEPFAIECAHYIVRIALRKGVAMPGKTSFRADIAIALGIPQTHVNDVKENTDGGLDFVVLQFVLKGSSGGIICPIEAFDKLMTIWSEGGASSGILSNLNLDFKPTKELIDFSEAIPSTPGLEEDPDYVLMIALIMLGLGIFLLSFIIGFYVRRRRARHEQTVKQVQSLEANWQLARTNSSRVYYFNPETGESRWTRPDANSNDEIAGPEEIQAAPEIMVHLPAGWHVGEHEGEPFYWHDDGESTSWEVPDWIPHGWIPPETFFQNPQYELAASQHQPKNSTVALKSPSHKRQQTTQIVDSSGYVWLVAEANSGTKYFYNSSTGESKWERPDGKSVYSHS